MAVPKATPEVWPGQPYPLGATWDGRGVNFALFSENAEKVELCLFDARGRREIARAVLSEYTDQIWHGYLPGVRPGALYGYRVYGAYDPERGHRFNHHKLLLDPYAKSLVGAFVWNDANHGYRVAHAREDLSFDRRDNARLVPKSQVVDTAFSWGDDRRPANRWEQTLIYELHVAGMTALHPDVPVPLRGTFEGLGERAVIDHLLALGVSAVELMPVHAILHERHLVDRRLRNYWGYNSMSYFAPEPRYMADGSIGALKTMVRRFHDAGIEVLLDVVYNHTGEGDQRGPTLSFRGIDNAAYYRLQPGAPRYYVNDSGCGNTLNLAHPRVMQMVMDSLRYWVTEMHVDGFRFDLAPALARDGGGFNPNAAFLTAVRQDPVLSAVKLIAEPWDLGHGGYVLGGFPPGWSEWNDQYRDEVRGFWKGEGGRTGVLASRLTGSSDIFERLGRRPRASINFVTAHDGFTLADLVSYNRKHNEANLDEDRDGTDSNHSWNHGVEGPTTDADILALRDRQKRNFLATLLLSQGVPMLTAGDELGRTQNGNNNAYCQDNEISWLDWRLAEAGDQSFLQFVRALGQFRQRHPEFRRPRFFHGGAAAEGECKDITWLSAAGHEMTESDWLQPDIRCFGFHVGGDGRYTTPDGQAEGDNRFIVVLNGRDEQHAFQLPPVFFGDRWRVVLDTAGDASDLADRILPAGDRMPVPARSLVLLAWERNVTAP